MKAGKIAIVVFFLLIVIGLIAGQASVRSWPVIGKDILWAIVAVAFGTLVSSFLSALSKREVRTFPSMIGWILIALNIKFLIQTSIYPEILSYILLIVGVIMVVYSYMSRPISANSE